MLAPAGGAVGPSKSDGSRPKYELLNTELVWSNFCMVADNPESILVRSKATAAGPTKVLPENWLAVM